MVSKFKYHNKVVHQYTQNILKKILILIIKSAILSKILKIILSRHKFTTWNIEKCSTIIEIPCTYHLAELKSLFPPLKNLTVNETRNEYAPGLTSPIAFLLTASYNPRLCQNYQRRERKISSHPLFLCMRLKFEMNFASAVNNK